MKKKKKKYRKTKKEQIYLILTAMLVPGESKREAKRDGSAKYKIFSYVTYKTYKQQCYRYADWLDVHYPKCRSIKKARKYVNKYLQEAVDMCMSAYTVNTMAAALNKLYGREKTDKDYFVCPSRKRADITRSRGAAVRDALFDEEKNKDLVTFAKSTGLRRSEMEDLLGSELVTYDEILENIPVLELGLDEGIDENLRVELLKICHEAALFQDIKYFVYVRNGKNGRKRFAPIVGEHANQVIKKVKDTPDENHVWLDVNSCADIHSYRAEYATSIYNRYARPIEDIPYDGTARNGRRYKKDVYTCRKDKAKQKYDKKAMALTSRALGHNRISVVADHYLRGV